MATSRDVLGLNPESIVLPNGEQLEISAYYSLGNRGISINIVGNDKTLIQVGGFKHSETSYDPSVIFLTPKGLYLSLLVGQ
ncbi:hypothetical protein C7B65_12565 [Phormidesmis priestleyi ULC007]|uniref:Uncharacterized protein n=1 Tax=Phormidesmis priestleyi ULC007 TaxID=1920490 RepID=A0A2T1DF95_9CYAN|nr:hypothetical protein [Phormidesmis priestleyi]PSB19111.1 hypothetical protein C7B65_12565 [Phormidesmis priestleyi ULC007]PZO49963.1 MAG: hypothetical protein DCF14_12510 [Phormidesmis priestleyi]